MTIFCRNVFKNFIFTDHFFLLFFVQYTEVYNSSCSCTFFSDFSLIHFFIASSFLDPLYFIILSMFRIMKKSPGFGLNPRRTCDHSFAKMMLRFMLYFARRGYPLEQKKIIPK